MENEELPSEPAGEGTAIVQKGSEGFGVSRDQHRHSFEDPLFSPLSGEAVIEDLRGKAKRHLPKLEDGPLRKERGAHGSLSVGPENGALPDPREKFARREVDQHELVRPLDEVHRNNLSHRMAKNLGGRQRKLRDVKGVECRDDTDAPIPEKFDHLPPGHRPGESPRSGQFVDQDGGGTAAEQGPKINVRKKESRPGLGPGGKALKPLEEVVKIPAPLRLMPPHHKIDPLGPEGAGVKEGPPGLSCSRGPPEIDLQAPPPEPCRGPRLRGEPFFLPFFPHRRLRLADDDASGHCLSL